VSAAVRLLDEVAGAEGSAASEAGFQQQSGIFSISRQTIARNTMQHHFGLDSPASKPRNWRNNLVNCELKTAIFSTKDIRPELE
jgi:hypothetical protein